jgi:quercetin dioxygenase-like cupin family protein
MIMRSILTALGATLFLAAVAAAQGTPTPGAQHAVAVSPDQVSWKEGPPSLPAGAKFAVLEGDPKGDGLLTMRVSLPGGYRIPPHSHSAVERVTVLEGTFKLGMGDKFEQSALNPMPAGSFIAMEPGTRHFVQAEGNTVVQINAVGPWKITYVNPSDDPRKAGK